MADDTKRLSDEVLADLLACAENLLEARGQARGMGCGPAGVASDFAQAANPATVAALVREVQAARDASRCETCKRPLNGWCEPACSGCDAEPSRCRCEPLP